MPRAKCAQVGDGDGDLLDGLVDRRDDRGVAELELGVPQHQPDTDQPLLRALVQVPL